jgi:hypothetical protein
MKYEEGKIIERSIECNINKFMHTPDSESS